MDSEEEDDTVHVIAENEKVVGEWKFHTAHKRSVCSFEWYHNYDTIITLVHEDVHVSCKIVYDK